MSELPARAQLKGLALRDAEQQALTTTNMTQNRIREAQYAHDINPHGEKAQYFAREVARLQSRQSDNQARHRALADLNSRIERYLDLLPADAELDNAKAVKIKPKPGETHLQAVIGLRVKIIKLLDERSQIERAGLPMDEIKAQARKWITQRALAGRPAILATHDKFDVRFTATDPGALTASLDPLALLAWFDPEHLETKINELIDEMPKPTLALTPAAKAERLASIKDELGDAERLECALIDAAQDEGAIIAHRPNVDIGALLGIVVSRSKASAAQEDAETKHPLKRERLQ